MLQALEDHTVDWFVPYLSDVLEVLIGVELAWSGSEMVPRSAVVAAILE